MFSLSDTISVEESKDLSSDVMLSGFKVVHDADVGGEDDVSKLSGRKNRGNKVFEILELKVEARRDDTALVKSSVEFNDDLAIASIIDNLELVDVAVLLHKTEELDEHLGDGSKHNLNED